MIVGVPSAVVPTVWDKVKPYIEQGLEAVHEYRHNADDLLAPLLSADMQLWVDVGLVVLTEIYKHPRATELSVGPISGKLPEDWEESLKKLEDWGRANGCTHIGTLGRPGWERKLGWRKGMTYCLKEL